MGRFIFTNTSLHGPGSNCLLLLEPVLLFDQMSELSVITEPINPWKSCRGLHPRILYPRSRIRKFQLDGISPGFRRSHFSIRKDITCSSHPFALTKEKPCYEVNLALQPAPKQSGAVAPPKKRVFSKMRYWGSVIWISLIHQPCLWFNINRQSSLISSQPLIA